MNRSIWTKIFFFATFLLALFPLMPFGIRSIVTILWALIGIVNFFYLRSINKDFHILKENKISLFIILLPFLLLIFSLTYSDNLTGGLNKLERMLTMLIFPVIFFLNGNVFSKVKIQLIVFVFSLSVIFLIFYQGVSSLLNLEYLTQDLTKDEVISNGYAFVDNINQDIIRNIKLRRFRNYIIELTNSHPTYQGLWISLAFFFTLSLNYKIKKKRVVFIAIISVIQIAWLLLLATRMPLLSILLTLIICAFVVLSKKKNKYKYLIISSIIVIASFSFIISSSLSLRVKELYREGFNLLNKESEVKNFNSSNVRNGIYYCSFQEIKKNPLIGVGIGDVQEQLNECYNRELKADIYRWMDFNTHNQYLFFWLSSGVFGLFSFLFFIFYAIKKSLIRRNYIFFSVLISSSLIFLTENVLVRSDGMVFFYFFVSIYLFNFSKETQQFKKV